MALPAWRQNQLHYDWLTRQTGTAVQTATLQASPLSGTFLLNGPDWRIQSTDGTRT